jgi:3-oxoacyl-[acyl-carrier protein] reductase
MKFDSQVVIVTGASRGIGRGIAQAFAAQGAQVACIATSLANASSTADAIGGKPFACDVSDTEQVEATIAKIADEMGVPSVLVNNAGVTRDTLMLRMKDEDWDTVLDINLKGAFLTCRAVAKAMMKARYGRIVNITSVVGLGGAAGQANYAAAKAGLVGLTKSVAREFGSRNITCNAVAPGFIETDMTEKLSDEFKEQVVKTAPAGRLGTPEDIAAAVLFLASAEAAYITGQVLVVDGGLTL